jgi:hemolysin activation/secretion protein
MSLAARAARLLSVCLLAVAVKGYAQSVAPDGAAVEAPRPSARFDIFEFTVEGNTVLGTAAIEAALYPHLGESRSIDDVEAARRALEDAYRQAGFLSVSVDVPEQKVEAGVVTLQVVEGRVGRLRVRNNRYFAAGTIVSQLPSVAEGGVPDFNAFQTELARLASADRTISPALKAGRLPGTLDVDLMVDDRLPLRASVELNNYHNVGAPPLRLGASLRYDDLFERQHSLSAQFLVTPSAPEELKVGSITYAIPLNARRDTLAVYWLESRSESLSGAGVGLSTVFGNQRVLGLRLARPLGLSLGLAHTLTLGVDHKRTGLDVTGASSDNAPLDYTPFLVNWTAVRADREWVQRFDASLLFSIRGVGNDPAEFAKRRYLADASYAALRLDATVERPIGEWRLKARAIAQLSGQPLVAYEQFTLGGVASARGYFESEFLGDAGLAASLELLMPRWAAWADQVEVRPLFFVDAGRAVVRDPLPEQRDRLTLASLGAGIRVQLKPRVTISLDAARAMRDGTATERGDFRITARMQAEY